MTRRYAMLLVEPMAGTNSKAPVWPAESVSPRLERCIAFLLVNGVINATDAYELQKRRAKEQEARWDHKEPNDIPST